jgi:hypothetical protein
MVFSGLARGQTSIRPARARGDVALAEPVWRADLTSIGARGLASGLGCSATPLLWTVLAPYNQTIFALDRRARGGASARLCLAAARPGVGRSAPRQLLTRPLIALVLRDRTLAYADRIERPPNKS